MERSPLCVPGLQTARKSGPICIAVGLALSAVCVAGCAKKEAPGPGAKTTVAAKTESAVSPESGAAMSAKQIDEAQRSAMKRVMDTPLAKLRVLAAITTGGGEPLNGPMGIALDEAENLYIADTGNARVVRCDKNGKYMGAFGGPGDTDGKFKAPVDLAFGPGGNLAVLDRGTGFVQAFSKDGKFVARVIGGGTGFYNPSGIAANANALYIADTGAGRLLSFAPGNAKGLELARSGWGPGELREPTDVLVDGEGILVVDDQKKQVLSYSLDGKFQSSFDTPAAGIIHIARLKDGSALVGIEQLARYDKSGKVIARYGQIGKAPGQFIGLSGLAVDKAGNVWVADSTRVQKVALE
jgi:tripartite motif-containing protein 71